MQKTLTYAAVVLLLSLLVVCSCIPIYTDELVWHSILARVFDDGLLSYTKIPECTSARFIEIPALLVPGRLLASVLYYKISPPYLLRGIAIVVNLFSVCLACYVIKRFQLAAPDEASRGSLLPRIFFVMAITAGISPAWRATARPEALFSIVLIGTVLMANIFHDRRATVGTVVLYTLLGLCVFSLHPKGLFFLPLILYAAVMLRVDGRPLIIKGLCCCTIVIAAAQSVNYYSGLYDCPNAPLIKQVIGQHMLNPKIAREAPFEYVAALFSNVIHVSRYARAIVAPTGSVYWGWLPPHDHGLFEYLWPTSVYVIFCLLGAVVLCGVIGCLSEIGKTRALTMRTGIPLALLVCELGLTAHQSNVNQYDGVFHIGMLGFTAALLMPFCSWLPFTFFSRMLTLSIVCGAVSIASFVAAYYPLVARIYTYEIKGNFPLPFHSGIQLYNYSQVRQRLWKLLKQCNIDLSKVNGILVDDSSYPYAQHSLRPVHTMGTTWFTEPGSNQYQVLQEAGIEAVIASCNSLKPEVVERSRTLEGYCCTVIDK
jgi:hypothetical protein